MKRITSLGLSAIAATTALWFAVPTAAHAGEQQGVQCPSGSTAEITGNDTKLRCSKAEVIERDAVCSAVNFNKQGSLDINGRIDHITAGRDVCRLSGGTATAPVQFVPLPGDPPFSTFQQIEKPGKDVFRATRTVFVFPEKGPIYNPFHKASNGVTCPAGYDGDKVFGDKGIRCDKKDGAPKLADCDVLFTRAPDSRGNEDRCLGPNNGPTKPQGMTKIQHDHERDSDQIGWVLDDKPGQDKWQRKVYAFPNSR